MLQKSIFQFLNRYINRSRPLLLALSGGVDSMSLFHLVNAWRKQEQGQLAIIHVDHGWRKESAQEASAIIQLAADAGIDCFHTAITPDDLSGNLECASREARYQFFQDVAHKIGAQGVLLAHTRDDQIETVFKRILEGAHLQYLSGMLPVTKKGELILFRPLLQSAKEELQQYAVKEGFFYFEDPTNRDETFLRARLRGTIFPFLRQHFGKEFGSNLIAIAEEAAALRSCYDSRMKAILENAIESDLGFYFDLTSYSLLLFEWLELLLKIQEKAAFQLSREQLQLAALFLMEKRGNKWLQVKNTQLYFDRGRLFVVYHAIHEMPSESVLKKGLQNVGPYEVILEECLASEATKQSIANHFIDLFRGKCVSYLPLGVYSILKPNGRLYRIKSNDVSRNFYRCLSDEKIPRFFLSLTPLIGQDQLIYEDFLRGALPVLKQDKCLRVIINRKSFEKCSHH